jgi:fermentation-respiration switch protein FrsA (DUF1100 family)
MYQFLRRIGIRLCGAFLVFSVIAGIVLAELTLRPPRWQLERPHQISEYWRNQYGSNLLDVGITAKDGAVLRAWYESPARWNGSSVILLHGVGDNREGVAGYAEMFLRAHYAVLMPDSRAHGESGGNIATYGLLETDDVHRWVNWLVANGGHGCIYGFGESMGAAIILQSLGVEHRFCGVVAESSYSTFRRVAYDRVGLYIGLGSWFGRTFGLLPVEVGIVYARLRYGVRLTNANPLDAVAQSAVPILLIHGAADVNILPWHSQRLARADSHSSLWIVPHAVHTGASAAMPQEFERRVLGFIASHPERQLKAAAVR